MLRRSQQFVLSCMLNGNLQERTITHFCMWGCCETPEQTYERFAKYVVAALIPGRCPTFARNRWTNQTEAIQWAGLLDAHHGLLMDVITAYVSQHLPVGPSQGNEPMFGDIQEDSPPIPDDDAPETAGDMASALEDLADLMETATAEGSSGAHSKVDWVAINKAFKKKAMLWVQSKPLPRLALLRQHMEPLSRVMSAFFHLGGVRWDHEQRQAAAAGQPRQFRVLQAWKNEHVTQFFADVHKLFQECPQALPLQCRTYFYRSMSFRLLSRASCTLHFLLRARRRLHPYRLFGILAGEIESILEEPFG